MKHLVTLQLHKYPIRIKGIRKFRITTVIQEAISLSVLSYSEYGNIFLVKGPILHVNGIIKQSCIFPHKFRAESPDAVGTQCACVPNDFHGLRETAVLQMFHQRRGTRLEISCLLLQYPDQ